MAPVRIRRSRRGVRARRWVVLAALTGSAWIAAGCQPRPEAPPSSPEPAWAGASTCGECHPTQQAAWRGSHHDQALRRAVGDAVLADLSAAPAGLRWWLSETGLEVELAGPDDAPGRFSVPYTFGVYPLQQYLVELPGGRLQTLSWAWDARPASEGGQRWFDLYPGVSPPDAMHWTGHLQNWNERCAECHSTGIEKRYDDQTDTYQTSWQERDVGCQACHGPSQAHVDRARAAPDSDPERSVRAAGFDPDDARVEIETCAPCHARRHRVSPSDAPGRPLLDDFMPATLREGLYHPDGQILDEVYVYGSFVQSRMYAQGVRCSDCHEPHSLALRADGDALCTRCHSPAGEPRFPDLRPARYDTPEHHRHPPASEGARCVSCHMPETTYMQVDPRRDHGLRVPRPDLTRKLGTPNACNGCHPDRSVDWAVERVLTWFGDARSREPHFGEALAAGRAGRPEAVPALAALVADPAQPAIVRATAAELSARFGAAAVGTLAAGTRDPDPLVRAAAASGLDRLPSGPARPLARALLGDPRRAVRVEAARVLVGAPQQGWSAEERRWFATAIEEYEATQRAGLDTPAGRLNLAVLAQQRGDESRAEAHYRRALQIDAHFTPARANLVQLYAGSGRTRQAEILLRDGIALSPEDGELHYSLGLLLAAEQERLESAEPLLGRAAELMPGRARVAYNHGLALQRLGRREQAAAALRRAHELEPQAPDFVYALAVLFAQQEDWDRALHWADQLVERAPDDPGARRFRAQVASAGRRPSAGGRADPSRAPGRSP